MEEATQQSGQQYLTFFFAGDEYAIEILRTREIIDYGTVTHVPGMPACIRGVLNLRGRVLPLVDLAVKFGLPAHPPTKQTCIVVVQVEWEGQPTLLGVLADGVNQVIELQPDRLQAPPAFGTRVRLEFLRGLGELETGFVLVLDIDSLLTPEELLSVSSPTEAPAEVADQEALST